MKVSNSAVRSYSYKSVTARGYGFVFLDFLGMAHSYSNVDIKSHYKQLIVYGILKLRRIFKDEGFSLIG